MCQHISSVSQIYNLLPQAAHLTSRLVLTSRMNIIPNLDKRTVPVRVPSRLHSSAARFENGMPNKGEKDPVKIAYHNISNKLHMIVTCFSYVA